MPEQTSAGAIGLGVAVSGGEGVGFGRGRGVVVGLGVVVGVAGDGVNDGVRVVGDGDGSTGPLVVVGVVVAAAVADALESFGVSELATIAKSTRMRTKTPPITTTIHVTILVPAADLGGATRCT